MKKKIPTRLNANDVIEFPRRDGTVLRLTRNPSNPFSFSSAFEDGTTMADALANVYRNKNETVD